MYATAKSLQSSPTLCDPIDGSPPGSPIPGILQARTLEWVAISFSNINYTSIFKKKRDYKKEYGTLHLDLPVWLTSGWDFLQNKDPTSVAYEQPSHAPALGQTSATWLLWGPQGLIMTVTL